jgi:hypothetical protein
MIPQHVEITRSRRLAGTDGHMVPRVGIGRRVNDARAERNPGRKPKPDKRTNLHLNSVGHADGARRHSVNFSQNKMLGFAGKIRKGTGCRPESRLQSRLIFQNRWMKMHMEIR